VSYGSGDQVALILPLSGGYTDDMRFAKEEIPSQSIYFLGAVVCFLAAALVVYTTGLPQRADSTGLTDGSAPELAHPAPDFSAHTVSGKMVRLSNLRGSPVIINFWATWCVPCRVEMPELQRLYEQYQGTGLRILAVNLGESAQEVAAWQTEFGLTFDLLLDPEQAIPRRYAFRDPPSTFIIAPDGTITHIFYGPVRMGQLKDALILPD
jgi:peroxiredoxin